jgi:hypothetical protein
MMGHARPYYASSVEESGYQKEKDLLANIVNSVFRLTAAAQRTAGWRILISRISKVQ